MKPVLVVVDDEVDILDSYKELLGDVYEVKAYLKASLFLKECSDQVIDINKICLVITDFNVEKGMNGIDLITELRQMGLKSPFILISGYIEEVVRKQAEHLGQNLILEKPFDLDLLVEKVTELTTNFSNEHSSGKVSLDKARNAA